MDRRQWLDIFRLLGLGWYVVTAIGVGVAAGIFIDRWADTTPILTLVGLALGILAAFWGMLRMVSPLLKRDIDRKEDR